MHGTSKPRCPDGSITEGSRITRTGRAKSAGVDRPMYQWWYSPRSGGHPWGQCAVRRKESQVQRASEEPAEGGTPVRTSTEEGLGAPTSSACSKPACTFIVCNLLHRKKTKVLFQHANIVYSKAWGLKVFTCSCFNLLSKISTMNM